MTALRLPALCLLAGLLLGWLVNGWRMGEQISEIRTAHAEALADAQARARQIESGWHATINEVQKNAKAKHEQLATHLSDADAAAGRLREQVERLSRRPARCPAVAGGGEAADPARVVLADVLLDLERRGRELAAEADRRRVAGLACEQAYQALSGQ